MEGSDQITDRGDTGRDPVESEKPLSKAESRAAKDALKKQDEEWGYEPHKSGMAIEARMGMAVIVILVCAFGFLVYHKFDLKQRALLEAKIDSTAEQNAVRQAVTDQADSFSEFYPAAEDIQLEHTSATVATVSVDRPFEASEPAFDGIQEPMFDGQEPSMPQSVNGVTTDLAEFSSPETAAPSFSTGEAVADVETADPFAVLANQLPSTTNADSTDHTLEMSPSNSGSELPGTSIDGRADSEFDQNEFLASSAESGDDQLSDANSSSRNVAPEPSFDVFASTDASETERASAVLSVTDGAEEITPFATVSQSTSVESLPPAFPAFEDDVALKPSNESTLGSDDSPFLAMLEPSPDVNVFEEPSDNSTSVPEADVDPGYAPASAPVDADLPEIDPRGFDVSVPAEPPVQASPGLFGTDSIPSPEPESPDRSFSTPTLELPPPSPRSTESKVGFPRPSPGTEFGVAHFVKGANVRQVSATTDDCDICEVQPNDNYWTLSKRVYGTARYFSSLALYNQQRIPDPKKLRPGMKVLIPAPEVLETRYPELFKDFQTRSVQPAGFFVQADGAPAYRIGERETLSEISQKHLGRASRWMQIYRMNQHILKDPNKLKPGLVLALPDDATAVHMAP